MQQQQWPLWTAVAAATSDVVYFMGAWSFCALWGEQPRATHLAVGLLRRLLQYAVLLLVMLLFGNNDDNNSTLWITAVSLILTLVSTVWGWRQTRVWIVQGGPYDAPSAPALSSKPSEKQVIVVTGANTGIGKETVRQLASIVSSESTILLLCRSVKKGQEAVQDILQSKSNSRSNSHCCNLCVVECDLSSYALVRKAAATILRDHSHLDCLINNAGVMLRELSHTPIDGHESMLQANYLGHFLLTALLLPALTASSGSSSSATNNARIVNVTSSTYTLAVDSFPMDSLDDLQFQNDNNSNRTFSLFSQYAATKWCNILHTVALLSNNNTNNNITAFAVHPGLVRTDVVRNMPWYLYYPNTWCGC